MLALSKDALARIAAERLNEVASIGLRIKGQQDSERPAEYYQVIAENASERLSLIVNLPGWSVFNGEWARDHGSGDGCAEYVREARCYCSG